MFSNDDMKPIPQVADFFKSLSQVYSLSQGRKLNLFMGDVDGKEAITSVVGNPSNGFVSTRVISYSSDAFFCFLITQPEKTVSVFNGSFEPVIFDWFPFFCIIHALKC